MSAGEVSEALSDAIERLYVHDDLAAKGLEDQWQDLNESYPAWADSPEAEIRYYEQVNELLDHVLVILGAYEEVEG